jgi:putative hydrolase of the HAD superfamily
MSIRAVTFDVGHTLLFPQPSLGEVYSGTALRHGIHIGAAEAEQRFVMAWHRAQAEHQGLIYGTDHVSAKAFWLRVIQAIFDSECPADEVVLRFLDDLYLEFSQPRTWRVSRDWNEVRCGLRKRGIRLGLVSNWDIRLRQLLTGLGLLADFDAVVISAELAVEKPDAAIFAAAASRLGVAPAEMLHLGDAWREDVGGARAAGSCAVWYNPAGAPVPEGGVPVHQARALTDVLALVDKSNAAYVESPGSSTVAPDKLKAGHQP